MLLQGSIFAVAEPNQYEGVMPLSSKQRSNSTVSTLLGSDDAAYDGGPDIYDDMEGESLESSTSSSSTTTSRSQSKVITTKTTRSPAHIDDGQKADYGEEIDSYPNELVDDETTIQDDERIFGDKKSINTPNTQSGIFDNNMRKGSELSTTSRIPFLPSFLWHDLFSKPGILVGIIGGVVIGMLSAILLVMFIIYRMRKKDEGSYALEEGPRKSPSHAYTRVSSREFFA
ncbi:unnamed protein product [Adineta ricciae]|uniref:Syndecan n=1 Tax=Adineta ricciae TaxID=249248 RepID=A0A816BI39_ADIRI|nr:unnamed protein product [Adineta ricciae]